VSRDSRLYLFYSIYLFQQYLRNEPLHCCHLVLSLNRLVLVFYA
jgi:hypothetical protein